MTSDEDIGFVEMDVCSDSDKVDSDVEEELYRSFHYESMSSNSTNTISQQLFNENTCTNIEILGVIDKGDTSYECINSSSKTNSTKHLESINDNNKIQNSNHPTSNKRKRSDVNDFLPFHHDAEKTDLQNSILLERFNPSTIETYSDFDSDLLSSTFHHTTEIYNKNSIPEVKTLKNYEKRIKRQKRKLLACTTTSTTMERDSDSDSDALLSLPYDSSANIHTNMRVRKTNILDIDSSSNDGLSSKIFNPSIDCSQVKTSDLWRVSLEDERFNSMGSPRNFMNKKYFCFKCKRPGHTNNFCHMSSKKNCHICGSSHPPNYCPKRICGKCHDLGHFSLQCRLFIEISCQLCKMVGHSSENCPDLWRRYHLTTVSSKFEVGKMMRQSRPIYCFNCGTHGHFGPLCQSKRPRDLLRPTWPYVVSYGKPKQIKKKKKKNVKPKNTTCEAASKQNVIHTRKTSIAKQNPPMNQHFADQVI